MNDSTADVVSIIGADRLVPIVTVTRAEDAGDLADALLAGGVRSVEVNMHTAAALPTIRTIAADGRLLVGAGRVINAVQVDRAVDAGARFVASPGLGPGVIRRCRQRGVPAFPGVATATEIETALDGGLGTLRFFPAHELGGTRMIRALAELFPEVGFIPTGGVTAANLAEYLAAPPVLAVAGTWMAAPDLVAAQRWREVARRTAAAVRLAAAMTVPGRTGHPGSGRGGPAERGRAEQGRTEQGRAEQGHTDRTPHRRTA